MGKLVLVRNTSEKTSVKKNSAPDRANYRFRLVNFKSKFFTTIKSLKNTKCTLGIHRAGLIISGDFCEDCQHISILSQEIEAIELVRGRETIDTFYLSPIHVLSKLGLPNSWARHFRFHPSEYKISETRIRIFAKEQHLELITSGYRFEKLLRTFKKMGYKGHLLIERKPIIDLSGFKNIITATEKGFF